MRQSFPVPSPLLRYALAAGASALLFGAALATGRSVPIMGGVGTAVVLALARLPETLAHVQPRKDTHPDRSTAAGRPWPFTTVALLFTAWITVTLVSVLVFPQRGVDVYSPVGVLIGTLAISLVLLTWGDLTTGLSSLLGRHRVVHVVAVTLVVAAAGALALAIARSTAVPLTWDAAQVMPGVVEVAEGTSGRFNHTYYVMFPNNALLQYLFLGILSIGGQSALNDPVEALVHASVVASTLAGWLLYSTTALALGRRAALIILPGIVAFVILCPWFAEPYSDSFGMPLMVVLLALAVAMLRVRHPTTRVAALLALMVASGIAYWIKPTLVFPALATVIVVCVVAARAAHRRTGSTWRAAGALVLCAILPALALAASQQLTAHAIEAAPHTPVTTQGEIDARRIPVQHFFLLGSSEHVPGPDPADRTLYGAYNNADLAFTLSHPDMTAAAEADVERALERYRDRGVAGTVRFIVLKNAWVMGDGLFYQWGEGSATDEAYPTGAFGPLFEHVSPHGSHRAAYVWLYQSLWRAVLIGALLAALVPLTSASRVRRVTADSVLAVARMSLLAFALYEAIFEARSRYAYVFVPVMLVLAAHGWAQASRRRSDTLALPTGGALRRWFPIAPAGASTAREESNRER